VTKNVKKKKMQESFQIPQYHIYSTTSQPVFSSFSLSRNDHQLRIGINHGWSIEKVKILTNLGKLAYFTAHTFYTFCKYDWFVSVLLRIANCSCMELNTAAL
jgi:sensor histidine kinase YesM